MQARKVPSENEVKKAERIAKFIAGQNESKRNWEKIRFHLSRLATSSAESVKALEAFSSAVQAHINRRHTS